MVLLMSLPDNYKLLVPSLKIYDSTRLTWEVVTTKPLNEEFMKRENGDSSSAFNITLVHTSHKNAGFKNTTKTNLKKFVTIARRKVTG